VTANRAAGRGSPSRHGCIKVVELDQLKRIEFLPIRPMNFNRQQFFGLNFEWYMVDEEGAIAMFLSGYGPIPKKVFENFDNYSELKDFVESLPVSVTRDAGIQMSNSHFRDVKAISKGLFVYDNEEYTDKYRLIGTPRAAINLSNFDESIRCLFEPLVVRNVIFGDVKVLNIAEYFVCD
jgi:hypothetical protein